MTQSHPENDHPEHTFAALANHEQITADKAGLEKNGFKVHVVKDRGEAFRDSRELDPGRCKRHPTRPLWKMQIEEFKAIYKLIIRGKILSEKDPLTSMGAVTKDGKLVHADFSGSKVGGVAFGAASVIVVAGSNKIVKNEAEAHRRKQEFAYEGESARTRDVFKLPGSSFNRHEVIHKVQQFTPGGSG
ncbi:MAG: hypothetical protein BYD32DRAFT_487103 [Podila humilis]|nr:MAG: hypothetical protein BYD32DRAFT_487103 [Podila humilis]